MKNTETHLNDPVQKAFDELKIVSFSNAVDRGFAYQNLKWVGYDTPWHDVNKKFKFVKGELTLFSGYTGQGKSEISSQLALHAVSQGARAFLVSLEMSLGQTTDRLKQQATGKPILTLDEYKKVGKFIDDKIHLLDKVGQLKIDDVIKICRFVEAVQRIDFLIIDNLMMLVDSSDEMQSQKEIVLKSKIFSAKYDAHVFIVAHPRKTDSVLTKADVKGNGDITSLADNVFSVRRMSKEEQKNVPHDTLIGVMKSRFSGHQEISIGMAFDSECKRFYQTSDKSLLTKVYGWRNKVIYDLPSQTAIPFPEL